jgi:hypothetical protein
MTKKHKGENMGYYTRFSLAVYDKNQEVDDSIFPEFNNKNLYDNDLSIQNLIDDVADSMKWYDHEDDMLEISKLYPDLVFVLDGDGEEAGDVWREFYQDGKTYRWELEAKRPSFDKKKLI